MNVLDYCSNQNGNSDQTVCIGKAIAAAQARGGARLLFPADRYRIDGTLTISNDGIVLEGEAPSRWASAGSTLVFGPSSADAIVWKSSTGGGIRHMRLDTFARTGDGAAVHVIGASSLVFSDLSVIFHNGFHLYSINNIALHNVWDYGPAEKGKGTYAIYWYGDAEHRADVLQLSNVSLNMRKSGGDGIRWDGMAHTMTMHSVRMLHAWYGL